MKVNVRIFGIQKLIDAMGGDGEKEINLRDVVEGVEIEMSKVKIGVDNGRDSVWPPGIIMLRAETRYSILRQL